VFFEKYLRKYLPNQNSQSRHSKASLHNCNRVFRSLRRATSLRGLTAQADASLTAGMIACRLQN